jgi:RNA polymerase sigma-70 factor (sigma-E family)
MARRRLLGDDSVPMVWPQAAALTAPQHGTAAGPAALAEDAFETTVPFRFTPAGVASTLPAAPEATGLAENGAGTETAPFTLNGAAAAPPAELDATGVVTALYTQHYQSLVRLAVLLVSDKATAEEVVQDSFIAMHAHWRRLRDTHKALAYLRRCVVNRSHSVLRHRSVVDRKVPPPLPDAPDAEQAVITLMERSAVVAALHRLSPRQREVVVLRYYAELSEAEIARAMGITPGAVKTHAARALSALRGVLGRDT